MKDTFSISLNIKMNNDELIKEKLIFGWGIDSWKIHGLKDYAALHNSILEILFYTGIFGLLWFLVIIMMTFKTIIINKKI